MGRAEPDQYGHWTAASGNDGQRWHGDIRATEPGDPHGIDATKRAHERRPAKFNVTLRPDGIAALQQFEIKDISEGGTFVLTQTLIPLGSRVNLRLVHPQTNDTFQIIFPTPDANSAIVRIS